MTTDDRIAAIAAFDFTTRQAAFLTTAMLHGGVCVQRQYAHFAGLANGHATRDFFDRLTRDRFATAHPCWRQGGRIYHIHHKGLYRAIGEPDNRNRRPATVARAIERLMILDAVLAFPETTWLATEREKVAYFAQRHGVPTTDMPALVFEARGTKSIRYFHDKLPIGISDVGVDVTFVYLASGAEADGLRDFLAERRTLLHRLNRWTLRVVLPSFLASWREAYRGALSGFCAAPIRAGVVEEFRWFCRARKARESGLADRDASEEVRYSTARRAFGAPRFYRAYRAWLVEGDVALSELQSPLLHDRLQRGDIRFETYVLPHQYQHLAPVVATA
jgi:hypothetical protein